MYANDTKTDLSIATVDAFDKKGTTLRSTWGDGTVSLLSLNACSGWSDVEVRPIQFGGTLAAHTEIVQSKIVIAKILDWLVGFEGYSYNEWQKVPIFFYFLHPEFVIALIRHIIRTSRIMCIYFLLF